MVSRIMTGSNARNRSGRAQSSALREFREQATAVRKDARHLAASAGAVASEKIDPIRQYVSDKPLQSLLIASGVGLVLGFLLRWR